MKDYELVLKVKNAPLLNIMRLNGYNTAAELSRAVGVSQIAIGQMLNLKLTAYNTRNIVRPPVQKIADFLKVTVDLIFPDAHLKTKLSTNTFTAQVAGDVMRQISSDTSTLDPSILLEHGFDGSIAKMTETLSEREAKIIKWRFEDDVTLRECGRRENVSGNRIRQIEAKALRKLRHPKTQVHVAIHSGVNDERILERAELAERRALKA